MAVFAGSDLKKWRTMQNISAADLAERINCDTTTIYRYESGKMKPDPDTMYMICDALGDVDKWTTWMRTEYPRSYGRVHPETIGFSLTGALMSMYAEIADVVDLQHDVMHDGADGKINNAELAKNVCREVTEMLRSAQRVKSLIEQSMKECGSDSGS